MAGGGLLRWHGSSRHTALCGCRPSEAIGHWLPVFRLALVKPSDEHALGHGRLDRTSQTYGRAARLRTRQRKHVVLRTGAGKPYSQSAFLSSRLRAFSETARFTVTESPGANTHLEDTA